MELTAQQQTMAFLWSFVLGAVLAAVYTVAALIKVLSPPTKIQLFVGDVLFMVFAAILNFLFATALTEGNVRFYTVFAELVSFLAIYLTVGRILKKIINTVYKWISAFFRKITAPLTAFSARLSSSLRKKYSFMLKKVKKSEKVRRFPLHCQHNMLYNTNDKSAKR